MNSIAYFLHGNINSSLRAAGVYGHFPTERVELKGEFCTFSSQLYSFTSFHS